MADIRDFGLWTLDFGLRLGTRDFRTRDFHAAAFWGRPDIVKILIERKADVNALEGDREKYTPLSEAYRLREIAKDKAPYDEVIRLLKAAGAK